MQVTTSFTDAPAILVPPRFPPPLLMCQTREALFPLS